MVIMYGTLFLGFFNTFFKAKVFTPAEIGVLSTIVSICLIINIFISFGSNSAIIKFYVSIKSNPKEKSAFLLFVLCLPILMMSIISFILVFGKDTILNYYSEPLLTTYYDLIFIYFIFYFFSSTLDMIYRAESLSIIGNFINNFLGKILTTMFLIFVILIMNGEFKYFMTFSAFLPSITSIVLLLIFFKRVKLSKPDLNIINSKFRKKYYTFCSYMFLSQATGRITAWIDKIFIAALLNLASVGIYSVVLSFVGMIKIISKATNMTTGLKISKAWNSNDKTSIKRIYIELANLPLVIGLVMLLFIVIWGKDLLLLIGIEYVAGYLSMIILAVGAVINIASSLSGTIIQYSDKFKYSLLLKGFLLFLAIVTNIVFIPIWGLEGAALATMLTILINNIVKLLMVYKFFKIHPYTKETVKIFFQFLVSLICLLFFIPEGWSYNLIQLGATSLILGVVYIITGAYIFQIVAVKNIMNDLVRILLKLKNILFSTQSK